MALRKEEQIQIRISKEDKDRLRALAKEKNMELSSFILESVTPSLYKKFQELLSALKQSKNPKIKLAEINDFLYSLNPKDLKIAIASKFDVALDDYYANYVAAMIEIACDQKDITIPAWTREIVGLDYPVFGSSLKSLRLHLLVNALIPFKARNIFIDSSIGDRV
jgi:hypothetical protein